MGHGQLHAQRHAGADGHAEEQNGGDDQPGGVGGSEDDIGQGEAAQIDHEQQPMQHQPVGDLIEQRGQYQGNHGAGAAQCADEGAGEAELGKVDVDVGPGDADARQTEDLQRDEAQGGGMPSNG